MVTAMQSNYAIWDVPRAFHMAQPAESRPALTMYKDRWFWAYWIIVIPSMLFAFGTVALIAVDADGGVVAAAAALALIEVMVVVFFVRWLKIGRGTPWRMVFLAVLWGSTAALMLTSSVGAAPIMSVAEKLGVYSLVASFGGAYPEEMMKGLGIWLVLWIGRTWWNRPWHGIVAGMLIGVGFDAYENMLYAINLAPLHATSDMAGMLEVFATRNLIGTGLHIIFSGVVGFGIGQAMFARVDSRGVPRTRAWRLGQVVVWGGAGFALHFGYNVLFFDAHPAVQLAWNIGTWALGLIVLIVLVWSQTRVLKPAWKAGEYPSVTLYIKQPSVGAGCGGSRPGVPPGVPLGPSGLPVAWPQPGGFLEQGSGRAVPPSYVHTNPRHTVRMPVRGGDQP